MGLLKYLLRQGEEDFRGTLVRVLRTFGADTFDLPNATASDFAEEAEAIARFVEQDVSSDVHFGGPSANIITRFVARRRRAESTYVKTIVPGLRDALLDLVRGVSTTFGKDEDEDLGVRRTIDELAEALLDGSPEHVRQKAEAAVLAARGSIERRQRRNAEQMELMGRRLQEMQERVATAEARSSQDKLTGLPNRSALDARLEQESMVAQLTGQSLVLIMVDIDHFKRFNDVYGHAAGDRVLAGVGDILVQSFPRKSDFAARYGGEEFCVVLSDISLDRAVRLADRFRKALADLILVHQGHELRVSCSAGVSRLGARENINQALERADQALYAAKRNGRNQVAVAPDPKLSPADRSRGPASEAS